MKNDQSRKWETAIAYIEAVKNEIGKVIIGQEEVIEHMLITLLCRGHCLIIGVPGLAKTLLVNTLGKILGLTFKRIQFTPDLMPSDIIGSEILREGRNTGERNFEFIKGPIFSNIILADEINRTPPKTQSALLEAMQERQVTVAGRSMKLDDPFVVFATQNPIEYEGTYPLPEAQLDRFFFSLNIEYPKPEEERRIVIQTTGKKEPVVNAVIDQQTLFDLQEMILDIPVPDHVMDYIMQLVQVTRPIEGADGYIKKYVAWGAGPRAAQFMTLGIKARALITGQPAASIPDVEHIAPAVLRHRLIPNYNATGEGITVVDIINHVMEKGH